jgi:hypothetical protein
MAITVKKHYPIPGRKDFYGYAVVENGKITKGANGKEQIFIEKSRAVEVASAKKRVAKKRATVKR